MVVHREALRWCRPGHDIQFFRHLYWRNSWAKHTRSAGRFGHYWYTDRALPDERHGSVSVSESVSSDLPGPVYNPDNPLHLAARVSSLFNKKQQGGESKGVYPLVQSELRRGDGVLGAEEVRRQQSAIVRRMFERIQDSCVQEILVHLLDPLRVQSTVRYKQHHVLHGDDFNNGTSVLYRSSDSGDHSDHVRNRWINLVHVPHGQVWKEDSDDLVLPRRHGVLMHLDFAVLPAGLRFRSEGHRRPIDRCDAPLSSVSLHRPSFSASGGVERNFPAASQVYRCLLQRRHGCYLCLRIYGHLFTSAEADDRTIHVSLLRSASVRGRAVHHVLCT